MIKKLLGVLVLAAVGSGVVLHVGVDSKIDPVSWTPPPKPDSSQGPYAANNALAVSKRFGWGNLVKPESSAMGPDGKMYTGLEDGRIVRFSPQLLADPQTPANTPLETVGSTGGRPLGMVFHPNGRLVIADAKLGLISMAVKGNRMGQIDVLSTEAGGVPFKFVDDVAVSQDGRMAYFSDASSKFAYPDSTSDVLEHRPNGRLLAYDFEARTTATVADNLYFANGVALAGDENSVLVNETAAYRITRVWLTGPKAGQRETFAEHLPGFPDNIRPDAQGNFWVAVPAKRDPFLDWLSDKPGLRQFVGKITQFVEFPIKPNTMVLVFGPDGKLVNNLQAPTADGYYFITQATPVGQQVYFNSIHNNGMAVYQLPKP